MSIKKAMQKVAKKRSQHDREKVGISEKAKKALVAMTIIDEMIDEDTPCSE